MMRANFSQLIYLILAVSSVYCVDNDDDEITRNEKLISTFQIVRFPNDVCVGSNSRNGTCYTSAECSDKSGTSSGSCADGFGVCCTFLVTTCGSSSAENNTYWTGSSPTTGQTCSLTLCPTSDDICSIRLDFTKLVLTGPSTRAAHQISRRFGQTAGAINSELLGSSWAGNCLIDQFTVQGASPSTNPPVVCGTQTGMHVYVEADVDRCNRLTVNIADAVTTSLTMTNARGLIATATREWDIRAQMIECTSLTLPPPGCTQYFWGSGKYIINSANWVTAGTSIHLANQHDRFCIRRERGYCIGCFYAAAVTDFMVSGNQNDGNHYTVPGGCCGYATAAGGIMGLNAGNDETGGAGYLAAGENVFGYGYDCIIIPGAFGPSNNGGNEGAPDAAQASTDIAQTLKGSTTASQFPMPWPPQICGAEGGIGIGAANLEEAALNMEEANADADAWALPATNTDLEFGTAINLSVCTRNSPFTLEFMSDDLEGIGGEAGNTEWQSITHNRGFQLYSAQIACS